MRKNIFIIISLILILAGASWAAVSTSASYQITAQVLDAGSALGTSTSYSLLGKARERAVSTPSSTNYIIGEGFLRSAYISVAALAPLVTAISPSTGVNTGVVSVTVSGANFASGASVTLSLSGQSDITASNVVVVSAGTITCDLNLSGAATGLWSVTVANTDGRSGTLPSAFTVTYPAPVVSSITPAKGANNETVNITRLAGNYFRSGANVRLSRSGEDDIIAGNVVVVSSAEITCRLNLSGAAVGYWDVAVANDDSQSGTLSQGFLVENPFLEIVDQVVCTPNPVSPRAGAGTIISYTLSKDADITIYVFNMRGERVWTGVAPSGTAGGSFGVNEVAWDGVTTFRSFVSAGVYFVHITARVNGELKTLGRTKLAVVAR